MTRLMENATSAKVLKWIQVIVSTRVDSSPLSSCSHQFPRLCGNNRTPIYIADSGASIDNLLQNQQGIKM